MFSRNSLKVSGLLVALLTLTACATTGASGPLEPLVDSVTATLLSEKDVKTKFGYGNEDPFYATGGALISKTYDYVVVRLAVTTNENTKVEVLQSDVVDKNGKSKATLYDRQTFVDFATAPGQSQSDYYAEKRRIKIYRYYLPSSSFNVKPGQYEYLLVLLGKHPLPDDVNAYVLLQVNGLDHEFTLPVPDQP